MHSLVTDEEGYARNSFWITDRRGRKLSSHNADLLAERVGARACLALSEIE